MSVAFILDFAGGGASEYDRVVENMGLGGRLSPGAIFHAAGASDGGWRVVDVWESDAAFEDFAQSKIMPLTKEAGLPEPAITRFEVHETIEGDSDRSELSFVHVVRFSRLDAASFDRVNADVIGAGARDGSVYHVSGPVGEGWVIVDGWTSREARDRFMAERVRPATEAHPEVEQPTIEDLEVHNTLIPA